MEASSARSSNPVVHALPSPPYETTGCSSRYKKGTTTVGFIYNKVVMVAVDHSSIPDGTFPENVIAPHPHLLAGISGGSKDSRKYFLDYLLKKCEEHESKVGRNASASDASKWLENLLSHNSYSDDDLPEGILIAGWDCEMGPALYKVDGTGELLERWALGTGCGSNAGVVISYGIRSDMPATDANELAKKAICLGAYAFPESCECFSVFQVGVEGVQPVIFNDDIREWQEQYFSKSPTSKKLYDALRESVTTNASFTALKW